MRLSVDKSDPGYCPETQRVRVMLNGQEVRGVITADEERRMLVRYARNSDGLIYLRPSGDALVTETVAGDVRIEFLPGHSLHGAR